jgi:dipeptidyl aminopeptidase/acylaminoacyl peptidase
LVQAPGTDIYLVPLSRSGGVLQGGVPVNLTARAGYDNQPAFSPDGRTLYWTSAREGQTDIYRTDLDSGRSQRVTSTPESEYSPTLTPDGSRLSVVRVEADSTQRLWLMDLNGAPLRPALDALKPVGYFAWLNADTVFAFVLGSPATLQRAEPATGRAAVVARDIGRTIYRIPRQDAVSFVQRDSTGDWIGRLDPRSDAVTRIAPLPRGTEFYAWTPEGALLSTRSNELVRWDAGSGAWETVARFSEPGLRRMTRLAVSPRGDRIALVGNDAAP